MSAQHTSGPWKAEDNSWEVSTVYSASGEVARCYIDSNVTEDTQDRLEPIKEANARLISAAPDLLEALQGMVAWADDLQRQDPAGDLLKARSAIAKATGGAA